jgi:hypothetical protein
MANESMWANESYFHPRLHNSVPRLLIDDQLSFFRLCCCNMLAVPHASNNTTFLSFDPTHAHDDQTAECGINRPILPIDPELSSSLQTRELSPTCDRLHTCSFGIRPVGEPWSNSRRLDVDDLLCMVATVPVRELIEAQLRSCIPRR